MIGSSISSGSVSFIASYFHVANEYQLVLPISVFLMGYIVGPIILEPLSEVYGRRIVLLSSFVLLLLFTIHDRNGRGERLGWLSGFTTLLWIIRSCIPGNHRRCVRRYILKSPHAWPCNGALDCRNDIQSVCSPVISGYLGKIS